MTGESNAKSGGGAEVIYESVSPTSVVTVDASTRKTTITLPHNIKQLCGLYLYGELENHCNFAFIYPNQSNENTCVKVYTDKTYPGTLWQNSGTALEITGNKVVITEEDYDYLSVSMFFNLAYTYIPE